MQILETHISGLNILIKILLKPDFFPALLRSSKVSFSSSYGNLFKGNGGLCFLTRRNSFYVAVHTLTLLLLQT